MKANVQRAARALHKWFGLALGVQLLLWSVSGLYMVAVDLDFIHGDFLVREPLSLRETDPLVAISSLATSHRGIKRIKLKALPEIGPVYELHRDDGVTLIDAVSGSTLSPLPRERIEQLAAAYYAGDASIARVQQLTSLPTEVRGRRPGMWQVVFDDRWRTHFYLDPETGSLTTRRHRWWRVFDTFWMLHVMDYGYERDDVNNLLLRATSGFAVVLGLTGVVLLFFSFGWRRRQGVTAA